MMTTLTAGTFAETSAEAPLVPAGPLGLYHLRRMSGDARAYVAGLRAVSDRIVQVRLGPAHGYTIFDPEMVHDVLVGQRQAFRKLPEVVAFFDRVLGRGLLSAEGEEWLQERRHLASFFLPARLEGMLPRVAERTAHRVDSWAARGEVELTRELSDLVLEIALGVLLGTEEPGDVARFAEAYASFASVSPRTLTALTLVPWLPLPGATRARRGLALLGELGRDLAARWDRAGRDPESPVALLAGRPEGGLAPVETIRARLLMLMTAGTVTTTIALGWVMRELVERPELQDRLAAARAAGDPTELRDRVIRETLRLRPPSWSLMPRQARHDVVIRGVRIHARAWIDIHPYVLHRDPRLFPDPLRLDPDRWLPAAPPLPAGAYLPFGLGPHTCPGQHLALRILATVVDAVCTRVRLAPVGALPGETAFGGLLVLDGPLRARAVRRIF